MPSRMLWLQRPEAPASFLQALPAEIPPLLGKLLWNRNIQNPDKVLPFLAADIGQLHDPMLLYDMDRAVARIQRAVAVYGDYDTDGVTGVALLRQAFTGLGLDVLPYIPKRLEEGYGLNLAAVEKLAKEVQLLVTVDCGISNVIEIARAQELGLDVIVLDHHSPPKELPKGYAVINPKRPECQYPYKMLAGVGVAYKLIQALHKTGLRTPYRGRDLLDVVALGTVTDVAPLDGENRVLVKYGLQALNQSERVGLRALVEASSVKGEVDCQTIGFVLGPRLNAAGRLDDAILAYELLLSDDQSEARRLAEEINKLNSDRQALTKTVQQAAHDMILADGKQGNRILVVAGDEFPSGVVGLVAARLVEAFSRPVLLLERGPEISRGSARSVPGFSIVDALTKCADLFEKYGGHSMAAGFSIRTERLPELEQRLIEIGVQELTDDLLQPKLEYDLVLPLGWVSCDLVDQVSALAPFGHGNPEPVWVSRNVQVVEARTMGSENSHLKLRVSDGRCAPIDAIMWRQGARLPEFLGRPRLDLAYTIEVNEWQGRRRPQLMLKDVRPTSGEF